MSKTIFDITRLQGIELHVIDDLLESIAPLEITKFGAKGFYKSEIGEIEIVFNDGLVDWITIFPNRQIPFNQEALRLIGLTKYVYHPAFQSPLAPVKILVENTADYKEIGINGDGEGNLTFFHIKTKSE